MPTVPYNPVPDVRPTGQGAPAMRISTPPAAFGTDVASAVSGIGGDLDKVGAEMFSRAMAIQELNNRADADTAVAALTEKVGQRHAAFTSLQGENAAKGFDPYMTDLHQLRDDGGAGLNPMALKLYNSESRGLISRTIFNGAGHAGQQAKVFQAGSASALLSQNADGAFLTPTDEASFQKKLDAVPGLIGTQAGVGGWDDNRTAHEVFKAKSELWRQRIIGLSKEDPPGASRMLADAVKNNVLEYKDWAQVDSMVKSAMVHTYSRVAADGINQGFDPRMSQRERDRAAGVQEPLVRIMQQAQRDHPELRFTIGEGGGMRTQAQQDALFAQGPSVTRTRDSNHLYGRALDIVPVDKSTTSAQIEAAMKEASAKLGIPLGAEHDRIKSWDPNHYSLPRDMDYSKVPKKVDEPLQSRVDRARVFAREQFPDNADFGYTLENQVRADFRNDLAVKRDFDYTNNTTVGNALLGALGDKVPTTIDELRAVSPEVAAAYDNQTPDKKRQTIHLLEQNSKDDYTANETNFRELIAARGLANENPAEFLDTDYMNKEWPRAWRKEIINLQQQKQKDASQDPRITHALQVLGPTLQNAQVTRDDKDRWNTFVGALQGELQRFSTDNKRPPKADEILDIGNRLLMQESLDKQSWWQRHISGAPRAFEEAIPKTDRAEIENAITKQGAIPTDVLVRRLWLAKKFQDLYGKPTTTAPTPPKPTVPQSQ